MKQRHRGQRGRRQTACHQRRNGLGRSHARQRADEVDVEQRLTHAALRRERALGTAGGAGGEQDQRRVIGPELGKHRRLGGLTDHGLVVGSACRQLGRAHAQDAATRDPGVAADTGETIAVAGEHARLDIGQRRMQFFAQPEAVERRRHRADETGRDQHHRPLGAVAHGDGDAITGLHVPGTQLRDHRIDLGEEAIEGPGLAQIADEGLVTVRACTRQQLGQGAKGIAIHPHRAPIHDLFGELERRAGGGELGANLVGKFRKLGHQLLLRISLQG